MNVIDQLAHTLGRRDELPNQALAKLISREKDTSAVAELVSLLQHKTKDIQHDAIKVLYETGGMEPSLIAPYLDQFLLLLRHKNNRLQWGAMAAIDSLTKHMPANIYTALPEIMAAADKGSVITRDHTVYILVKLSAVKKYAADTAELLLDQLRNCPANQAPMYAEKVFPIVTEANARIWRETILQRLDDMPTAAKRSRLEKICRKLEVMK